MKRSPIRSKRKTPRRRPALRWDAEDWQQGNLILMARADYACERCGHTDKGIERHHRKRRRDGGESFPNLTALCVECHGWAHSHPALARKYGYIVSVNRNPVEVPMLWRSREWVYLDEDGGKHPLESVVEDAHA